MPWLLFCTRSPGFPSSQGMNLRTSAGHGMLRNHWTTSLMLQTQVMSPKSSGANDRVWEHKCCTDLQRQGMSCKPWQCRDAWCDGHYACMSGGAASVTTSCQNGSTWNRIISAPMLHEVSAISWCRTCAAHLRDVFVLVHVQNLRVQRQLWHAEDMLPHMLHPSWHGMHQMDAHHYISVDCVARTAHGTAHVTCKHFSPTLNKHHPRFSTQYKIHVLH